MKAGPMAGMNANKGEFIMRRKHASIAVKKMRRIQEEYRRDHQSRMGWRPTKVVVKLASFWCPLYGRWRISPEMRALEKRWDVWA